MKILRTIGILALVAGLVLGGVGSALAEKPDDVPRGGGPHSPGKRGLSGNVTSLGAYTKGVEYIIHLKTMDWGTVAITANVTTKYMVPREAQGPQNLADFLGIVGDDPPDIVGRRLAVLAANVVGDPPNVSGDAIRLMLVPSPGSLRLHAHRVGVVQVFDPDATDPSITIIGKDGESHTFILNSGTVYRPDTIKDKIGGDLTGEILGRRVTVVVKGDPKKAGLVAKAVVQHELPQVD